MIEVRDLGVMRYRDAWALQEQTHAELLDGGVERIILVEHQPVITTGRRPGQLENLLHPVGLLQQAGVELVESDRGGDVTFHGPGQLVAYPIIRLSDHQLSVSGYVHLLEDVIIQTLAACGLTARKDPCAIGVWIGDAKIAAIGVRIRRGVTMHGLALNVDVNLDYFNLIVPCGLIGRRVTSMKEQLGDAAPPLGRVKQILTRQFIAAFAVPPALRPAISVSPDEETSCADIS